MANLGWIHLGRQLFRELTLLIVHFSFFWRFFNNLLWFCLRAAVAK
jgi:hypothetical protein